MRNRENRYLSTKPRRGQWMGKLVVLLAVIAIAVLAQGCTQILDDELGGGADVGGGVITPVAPIKPAGPLAATVRVVSDPQGGSYVSELSCVIEATEVAGGGSNPIIITVNWVAPCGTHKSESFVFNGGAQTYESTYSESGRDIVLTFWTTISWQDAQGQHQIQSGIAACS